MKKQIVLIAITFILLNVNSQNTDNFCDPELKSKIDDISKMGGTFLKEFLIPSQELKWDAKTKKFSQSFTVVLSKNNVYRFYLLSSSKIPCETMLSLPDDNGRQLKVIKQKSGDPVAFEDVEIKTTYPYEVNVSFANSKKGCAMVLVSFMSTKPEPIVNNRPIIMKTDTSIAPLDYVIVEENAKFNGGDLNEFRNWVASNFKVDTTLTKGVQGKIFIQFVVNTSGKVERAKIIRSCGVYQLDQQAILLLQSSPLWSPAKQRGKFVNQQFTLPILIK